MSALFACQTGDAMAGAFLQPPGEGQIIVTSTFTDSLQAFDRTGRVVPVLGYRKLEITGYVEYGLTDWMTEVVSPSYESVWSGGPPEAAGRGPGASQAGARFRLLDFDAQTIAAQVSVLAPNTAESIWRNNAAGAEARLFYGMNATLFDRPAFIDLQSAYRRYGGVERDELRVDATFGVRLWPTVLFLAQSFNIVSVPRRNLPAARSTKLQISGVYEFHPNWSLQVGAFASLTGANAGVERGVLSAIWRKF